MEKFQISAKNLGKIAMPDFCARCFWIELKAKKLPWQKFPGIFSTIDSFTKKIVHEWIDRADGNPKFLKDYGVSAYQMAPHWSKFKIDTEFGITLSGAVDDIWTVPDGSVICDFKTAKWTANADKLLPMYRTQLNGYAKIAEGIGMGPVVAIPLIYMVPQTEEQDAKGGACWGIDKFNMHFVPHVLPLELDIKSIDPLLERARKIYDGPVPASVATCKDCTNLDGIIAAVGGRKL